MAEAAKAKGKAGRAFFVLFLLLLFLTVGRHQWAADIRDSWDDTNYLSYAMSFGLDFDLDFSNEIGARYALTPSGVPKHYFGAGMMAAPFVALTSVVDRLSGHPVIEDRNEFRHSWTYVGFSLAVHVYFLATFLLLWKVLAFFVANPRPLAVLLAITGSGLFYYVAVRCRMAHVFEVFSMMLAAYGALLSWKAIREQGRVWIGAALAATGVLLTLTVRANDIHVVGLPLLIIALAHARATLDGKAPPSRDVYRYLGVQLGLIALAMVPLVALNILVYGAPYPTPEVMQHVPPLPHPPEDGSRFVQLLGFYGSVLHVIPRMFFGAEMGLLYTNPAVPAGLALGIWVFVAAWRNGRDPIHLIALTGFVLYFAFNVAIAMIWQSPGASYGWRYVYPLFPVGLVACFAWWGAGINPSKGRGRKVVIGIAVFACVFSTASGMLFTKNETLGYTTSIHAQNGEPLPRAPDYMPNLLAGMASGQPWSTALKDGVFGFVRKSYLGSSRFKWYLQEAFGIGDGKAVFKPMPHPPMVGRALGVLFLLWLAFALYCLKVDRGRRWD